MDARWLGALWLVGGGCSPVPPDYIEAHGRFPDGAALDVHLPATTLLTPSVQPALGQVTALTCGASGPENLRGLRLEWLPSGITVGTAQPSSPGGPAIFYVGTPLSGGGMFDTELSVVNGGEILFNEHGRQASGTLAALVLSRRDATGTPQTLLTIDSGAFFATNP